MATEAKGRDGSARGAFAGRQREMEELKAALEDALSGRGRLVMLAGGPGIGKTRTALELATYAELRQARVLWGRCKEGSRAPPYWPWVQALGSYAGDLDPVQLRSELGAGAADIAGIVVNVREQLPDLDPPLALEPEQARLRLFDSIASFLKNAAGGRPLVLLLDDLHHADESSLLLLRFLVRQFTGSPLLLVGTYRDGELNRKHPLAQTIRRLDREGFLQRIALEGLGAYEVERYLQATTGIAPPRGLVKTVHTRTGGNPLFLTELVRVLVDEEELVPRRMSGWESWSLRIPESVAEVIGRRLERLSRRCRQTITVASVIGPEFSLEQLQRLIDVMSVDTLLELLHEAAADGILEEAPPGGGSYRFTHTLIHETLVEELPETQRVRVHGRIAQVMEDLYGADVEAHAGELAYHFDKAVVVTGTEKLVRYSLMAGERALAMSGEEGSLGHFRRALTAKQGQAVDAETARLHFGLGRGLAATGHAGEACVTMGRGFESYVQLGDVANALDVAMYPLPSHSEPDLPEVTRLVQRGLMLVPEDSLEAGRLFYRYGTYLHVLSSGYERVQDAFKRALAIAQQQGEVALEMCTLTSAARVDAYHMRLKGSLEKAQRAIELAAQANDAQAEAEARFLAALGLLTEGSDLEGARLHAEAGLAVAEVLRHRSWMVASISANEMVFHVEGNWQMARDFSDRGLALAPLDPRLNLTRVPMDYQVGDFAEGEARLEQLVEAMRRTSLGPLSEHAVVAALIPMRARITGVTDQFPVAEAAGKAVLASEASSLLAAWLARIGQALMAVQKGDKAAAAKLYSSLESRRGTMLEVLVSADRLLGLLSLGRGRPEEAIAHFEDALEFCRRAGYRADYAWTCWDYAEVLLGRDAAEDHERAMSLLDEALSVARELGMRPLLARVLARNPGAQDIDSVALDTSIEVLAAVAQSERPDLRGHAAVDGNITVLCTDIAGSTALAQGLGDEGWPALLDAYDEIVRQRVAVYRGFEVKSQGDAFIVAFPSARRSLQCAIAIQRGLADYSERHAGEQVRPRMGLHSGVATEVEESFGDTIGPAARMAAQAQGGQILVSLALKGMAERKGEYVFDAGREVELNGPSGMERAFEVRWH